MGDLRAELQAAFDAELAEHMAAIRAALADADAGRSVDLREFSRRTHSLKGAARAVELPETEAAAHDAETIVLAVERGERVLAGETLAELRTLADRIEDSARPAPIAADVPAARGIQTPAEEAAPAARVHVGGQHVERLARTLHELTGEIAEQVGIADAIDALCTQIAQIVPLASRSEDGELSRRAARALAACDQLRSQHARRHADLDRVAAELERDAERILLLPVATLFEGHERMVRELAASQGKQATLRVEAIDAEADRRVLHALREPMLHLLRNAVSHGIEPAQTRERAGKPGSGTLTIEPRTARGRLTIVIRDDGAGLDHDRIEAQARAVGLIARDAPRPSRRALQAMVFEQGFSTARAVDTVSGRGIGLSVVADTIRRLHGRVRILPAPGGGTEIRLSVPLALSRQALVMVDVAGERFGIPANAVDRVLRASDADIVRSGGHDHVLVDGDPVALADLASIVGVHGTDMQGDRQLVVIETADARRAMVVDAVDSVRTLVVGDPTAIAADVPLIYGTVLDGDRVALVLSPEMLAEAHAPRGAVLPAATEAQGSEARRRTILVVDDSITTRTLEKSILEAQGYHVLIAVDGLTGLERLRAGTDQIDLVVADVEMPRMDGFTLLAAIRNDPALGALPVVMMTSRNSPDDVERGLSLGANAYVTKQDFDQGTLISTVQQLL